MLFTFKIVTKILYFWIESGKTIFCSRNGSGQVSTGTLISPFVQWLFFFRSLTSLFLELTTENHKAI